MKKADLLNSGKLEATKEIIDIAKADKPQKKKASYGYGTYEIYKYYWYFRAKTFEIKGKTFLKVAIFRRKDLIRSIKSPAYVIYISKDENRHITYDFKKNSWRTAKIDYLSWGENSYYYEIGRYSDNETEKTIIEYLNNEKKTVYESIFRFQSNVQEEKLYRQHKKITDRIDSAMELVPELPKDFDNWVDETAMIKSRYIYYNYSRNVKEGFCTYCEKMVPISKPHHNGEGTCKCCKSHITFKAIKKAAIVRDDGYATIFQRTKEGFVLRYFEIRKTFEEYIKPKLSIQEAIRILYNNSFDVTGEYEFAEFKNTGAYRWCFWEDRGWSNTRSEYKSSLYTANLKKVFEGTVLQYSCIDVFAKGIKGERFYPAEYFKKFKSSKYIEYLVKLKLFRLTKDLINTTYGHSEINEHGTRIHEVLKVSKEQVKTLCEMNASTTELRVLQKANDAGVKMTKDQIRWVAENLGRNDLINYMKYSTVHKMIRYLKDQGKINKLERIQADYYDYLDSCEKLGYDLRNSFILYPKNLKEAHDLATAEWRQRIDRINKMGKDERNKEMELIAEDLVKKFAMKDKKFSIRIPWTCEEIKNEGQALHHCVGGYVDRVLQKETAILFIRKIDDINTPFYTMEVKDGKIIQVRGKNNCSTTPEVQAFVDKFKTKKLETLYERMAG